MPRRGPETTEPIGPDHSVRSKLSVIVVGDGVFTTAPLPRAGRIVLGRDPGCDLVVEHASISRRHAALELADDIAISDLDSRNGTTVDGRRLGAGERAVIAVGSAIRLGSVTLVIEAGAAALPSRKIEGHAELAARLVAACQTARVGRGPTVIRVLVEGAPSPLAIGRVLTEPLRAGDRVATVGVAEHEIVLFEASSERTAEVAAELAANAERAHVELRTGAASYGEDGTTAEALFARAAARARAGTRRGPDEALVTDPAMRAVFELVERVAPSELPVLVLGETGSGKEIVARAVHHASARRAGPFLGLNCAALPEQLLEGELFGYDKGAFTGALHSKPGLLEAARGGTVFLDELGDMPLAMQAKLLRVVEQREVMPLGALAPRPVDVRFVAATHHDLAARVAVGQFRSDLYYRLGGVTIAVPALRDRPADLEPLARLFARRAALALGREPPGLAPALLDALYARAWPGNVRELRHAIERGVLLCEGAELLPEHLGEVVLPAFAPAAAPAPAAVGGDSLRAAVERAERDRIVGALAACGGNQTKAAKVLGISRRTLVQRLDAYGLPRPKK